MNSLVDLLEYALRGLVGGMNALAIPAVFFGLLALAVKRRGVWDAARRAGEEIRVNLWLYFLDIVFVVPILTVVVAAINLALRQFNLIAVQASFWEGIGTFPTLLLVVFLGDFIGYWRHRLEHSSLLWPSHAIHHSDTQMTWLALSRFHPVNRLTTVAIDSAFLTLLGFPAWATVANSLVRHYYGYFIHADLPWSYGALGRIFVSPAMHRWHHARELRYAGTNFATVFSVFDRAFGTFSVPGPCTVALGTDDNMGIGVRGQLAYPIKVWARKILARCRGTRRTEIAGG